MRNALSWAVRVALAAAVGLAIAALAEDAGTPTATRRPVSSTTSPETTREGPHHGSLEPSAASIAVGPANAAACANEGWRLYSKPKFVSQKSCELWVRRHAAPGQDLGVTPPEKEPGGTEVRTAIPFLA